MLTTKVDFLSTTTVSISVHVPFCLSIPSLLLLLDTRFLKIICFFPRYPLHFNIQKEHHELNQTNTPTQKTIMTSTLDKALPKPPKIELYSGKYFLACGIGGIIGMQNIFEYMRFPG